MLTIQRVRVQVVDDVVPVIEGRLVDLYEELAGLAETRLAQNSLAYIKIALS